MSRQETQIITLRVPKKMYDTFQREVHRLNFTGHRPPYQKTLTLNYLLASLLEPHREELEAYHDRVLGNGAELDQEPSPVLKHVEVVHDPRDSDARKVYEQAIPA